MQPSDKQSSRQKAIRDGVNTYIGAPCKNGHSGLRYVGNKACVECCRDYGATYKKRHADTERERKANWKREHPGEVSRQKREYRERYKAVLAVRNRDYLERDPNGTLALHREFNAAKARLLKLERDRLREEQRPQREAERQRRKAERKEKERLKRIDETIFMTAEEAERKRAKARESYYRQKAADPEGMRLKERLRRSRHRAIIRKTEVKATTKQIQWLLKAQSGKCAYCGSTENLHLDHKVPLSRGGPHSIDNLQWLCAYHNMNKRVKTDSEYRAEYGIPECTQWDSI